MGTDQEETSLVGKWYRRIYGEAYRRMGVPLSIVTLPTMRLTVMADAGEVDGQPNRLAVYAAEHPNQIRVDEVLFETKLSLYAFDPEDRGSYPKRLEELTSGKWMVEYRRGVVLCEKVLKPLLPADKLSDIANTDQGMKKLQGGRTHLLCDFTLGVEAQLLTPEFKGIAGFRPVLDLGVTLALYPYVHKNRAELAPRLAETLKKMKAEGLIDRYFREAKREIEATR